MGRPELAEDEKTAERRVTILYVQGSEECRDWFEMVCQFVKVPGPTLFDIAMSEFAERRLLRPMPKRGLRKPR